MPPYWQNQRRLRGGEYGFFPSFLLSVTQSYITAQRRVNALMSKKAFSLCVFLGGYFRLFFGMQVQGGESSHCRCSNPEKTESVPSKASFNLTRAKGISA